jgi:general stress protein 26
MTDEAQSPVEPAEPDEQRALWQRLADEKVAMLGTRDADGSISGRPVQPVRVEPEGHVWIFTAADGDIALDVARDARVHVAFVNPADELYVSLNGEARVLRDPRKARELWSTATGVWFPGGPDDPNLGLLRIDVHRGDYWDMKDARLVRFFKLAAAVATGTRPDDVATHRRFTQ